MNYCCPLHVHSEYSAFDGVSRITEIVERFEQIGAPGGALTDHGVVTGHIEFEKKMRQAGLNPLMGCELYHGVRVGEKLGKARDQAHLIALAMTDEGLKNLWRLTNLAAQEARFHHVGRNIWDDFEKCKEGIVFTSACPGGLVAKGLMSGDYTHINRYLETFGDNFYIELTTYPGDQIFDDRDLDEPIRISDLNEAKVDFARERGLPLTYGDDGHYAFPDQFEASDCYVAKSTGQSIYTPLAERKMYHPEGALCIKDYNWVREALAYLPDDVVDEAIRNSNELVERADAHAPETRRHLPVFIPNESPWVPEGQYADDEADLLFLDLVENGMRECYGDDPDPKVIEQTAYEAKVFLDPPGDDPDAVPLFHYFLLAWDVMQYCKDPAAIFADVDPNPIERGPGRGSSAGCIVARELEITDIDPLPYDLYFERFWNPGRAKGFPDIDSDFEQRRLKEITRYLSWRWGDDKVRTIGTTMRMKPKSTVDNLGPVCGLTDDEMTKFKGFIEQVPDIDILGTDQIGWDEEDDPGKVVYVMHSTPQTKHDIGDKILDWVDTLDERRQYVVSRFLWLASKLCSRVTGNGVHPSGVVVSDENLEAIAPCRFAGQKEQRIPVTQFPMDVIESLMLVKFDRLGLRTLDVLSDWKKAMKAFHDIEIEWSQLEWTDIPDELWEMVWEYCANLFQIERGYPAKLVREFKPRSVEDLSIIVALNRPGPIRSGAPESFIVRRNGGTDDKFDGRKIPILSAILEPTYGWFLYQEQVIAYFNALGYDPMDADAVRKILGKKQPEKWAALHDGIDEWAGKSYIEMTARAGVDEQTAEIIWAMLVDFAKYSFNKAHSVAYATIAFRCAYGKYYGTEELVMSAIKNVDQNKKAERIPETANEAHRLEIGVHGVDIERSQVYASVYEGDIYFGFNDVKGVSEEGAKYLVELRDGGAPMESPEALAEYVKGLSKIWSKENARRKKEGLPPQKGKSPGQKLNAGHITNLYTAGAWERLEGYPTPLRDMQAREREMLNVILSDNCAEKFAEHADEIAQLDDTYFEAKQTYPGYDQQFTLPGMVSKIVPTKTRADKKPMGIVTIEWEGDQLEFAVFPKEWRTCSFLWHERTPGIFTIRHAENPKTGKTGYNFKQGVKL